MKIQCPDCKKVYQVDDSKIPEAGTFVKCKCETKFFIKKDTLEAEEKPIIHDESRTEEKCPKCSHNRNSNDLECPYCGIYYGIYEENLKKKKIQKEPKTEEELKAEEILKLKEALKKAEEALKAADGRQKSEEILDKNKKTLKYTALAVTVSIGLLFGAYYFYFSPNKISSNQKYIDAYEYLKRIEAYFESGVTIVNLDNAIAEARFRINLVTDCPEKKDFLYALSIFSILRDAWYYYEINLNIDRLFQSAKESAVLYEPLQKLWEDSLSKLTGRERNNYEYLGKDARAMQYADELREQLAVTKEYLKKAKPILFTRANEVLSKIKPI